MVRRLLARTSHTDPLARLTGRERAVLGQMARATPTQLSPGSCTSRRARWEKHVNMIFDKLDLNPAAGHSRRVLAVLRYLGS